MNIFRALKRTAKNTDKTAELLKEIRDQLVSQQERLSRDMHQLEELCSQMAAWQQMQLEFLMKVQGKDRENTIDFAHFERLVKHLSEHKKPLADLSNKGFTSLPLFFAEKTYNTCHPDYDATKVRNYPGHIFNADSGCKNPVYKALSPLIKKKDGKSDIPDKLWAPILDELLAEVKAIPHANELFENKKWMENYVKELSITYNSHYNAGWVNLEDALFLYWTIRMLKPKTIVQTGVCNGLSTALMVLALVKNGPEGRLLAIDLPEVFDPKNPAWTVKNQVYGVVIPEGKSSGWLVPKAYQNRFEIACGNAKELLPSLVDKLDHIDMFYHDSDHTYHHMMFEFSEVKRKLVKGGIIVADDISWNESLWDFADMYRVPSYNYKGAIGVAFF